MSEPGVEVGELGSIHDEEALAALSRAGSLLDGRLIAFCVRSNGGLEVEMTFQPADGGECRERARIARRTRSQESNGGRTANEG